MDEKNIDETTASEGKIMDQNTSEITRRIREAIQLNRLLDSATSIIEVSSPTRSAGPVADRLEQQLRRDGFEVERVTAGWPEAPAVVARLPGRDAGGRTLQFNAHLDTVHLPFVPPRVENENLYGSGAADMKGGLAAAIEAMRALRDTDALENGSILLTAHDLHESPWGDSRQVNELIAAGYVGDGVLLPEYLSDRLPVIGRGLAILEIDVTRPGQPVHEVLGGIDVPQVIGAGAEIVRRLTELDVRLTALQHPLAGRESMFVGQFHAGEIYNQAPTVCSLSGTRRWLPGTALPEVEHEYRQLLAEVADRFHVQIDGKFHMVRDAYEIDPRDPLCDAFQAAHREASGQALPIGAKPFVDDGNAFASLGKVPAITHGPNAKGAHTLHEEVPLAELTRVALVYALTALNFCSHTGAPQSNM